MRDEVARLGAELALTRASASYRLAHRFQTLRRSNRAVDYLYLLAKRGLGTAISSPAAGERGDSTESWLPQMLGLLDARPGKTPVLVYAGAGHPDLVGASRGFRFARAFAGLGCPVIFVGAGGHMETAVEPGMLAVSRDGFLAFAEPGVRSLAQASRPLLLVECPDPAILSTVALANALGFETVYDVARDWPAAYACGEAPWFDAQSEAFLLRNASQCMAATPALAEKFAHLVRSLPDVSDADAGAESVWPTRAASLLARVEG